MATIGSLIVEIGASTDGLKKGLDTAKSSVSSAGSSLGGAIGTGLAASAAIGVAAVAGIAAGAAAVGVAAFGMANDVSNATNTMQAQLGLTKDEAESLTEVAKGVFGNNFAESVTQAAEMVAETRKQLGALSDNELQRATESAQTLSDAFGEDYTSNLNAAKGLVENFGLSQEQAFDLIATGFQDGLNTSGDFLDSLSEYSNQFSGMGFSADEMFNIMESGLGAGVLGTDKIADSFKEMGVILTSGTDDAHAALAGMGLDLGMMQEAVASGESTWADFFPEILNGMQSITDPIQKAQAEVALFGTMAEDLGPGFSDSLSLAGKSLDDMTEGVESLGPIYNNLGSLMEGFKKQALLALEPIGNVLLDLANEFMPLVQEGMKAVGAAISSAMEAAQPLIEEFGAYLKDVAVPAIKLYSDVFINDVLPVLTTVGTFLAGTLATALGVVSDLFKVALGIIGPVADDAGSRWDTFKSTFQAVMEYLQPTMDRVVEGWQLFKDAIAPLSESLGGVGSKFSELGPPMEKVGEFMGIVLVGAAQLFGETLAVVLPIAGETIRLMVENAITLFEGLVDFFGGAVTMIEGLLTGDLELATEGAEQVIQSMVDVVTGIFTNFGTWLTNITGVTWDEFSTTIEDAAAMAGAWLSQFTADVVVWFGDAWESIKSGVIAAKENLLMTISETIESIKTTFTEFDWKKLGSDLIDKIKNGISSGIDAIKSAASDLANKVKDAFTEFDWWEVGKSIINALIDGLKSNLSLLGSSLKDLITDILKEYLKDVPVIGGYFSLTANNRGVSNPLRVASPVIDSGEARALRQFGEGGQGGGQQIFNVTVSDTDAMTQFIDYIEGKKGARLDAFMGVAS